MDRSEDIPTDPVPGPVTEPRMSPAQRWLLDHRDMLTKVVPLAFAALFLAFGVAMWLTGRFEIGNVGFAGLWFFSFLSAASIIIPVPGLAAVCVAASPSVGLNPVTVGIVSGSAEALGELTGYLAGMGGRGLVQRNRFYPRIRGLLVRRGGLILFCGSVVPNPLFDLLGIAAGSMLYPVRKFLLYIFIAKSIKSTGIAFACYWGINWVQDLIN